MIYHLIQTHTYILFIITLALFILSIMQFWKATGQELNNVDSSKNKLKGQLIMCAGILVFLFYIFITCYKI